ncbi:hypothetical protein ACWGJP_06055 [Microbacterium sp. NPDC055903]
MSTHDNGGHDVPLTPPPASAATPAVTSAEAPAVPAQGSPARGPIGVVLAVIGGIALVISGTTAAFAAGGELMQRDSQTSLDVDGIRGLDLEVGASDVTVVFADVAEAELTVEGGRGNDWTMRREEDDLVVHSPDRFFGWWFDGWFGNDERVVLTLPESLQGIDADLDLSAGSLDVTGEFGELDAVVGAGALFVSGSAESLDAQIDAGRAEIMLADVAEADLTVSAGRLTAELTGTTPREIVFDVSAGSLELVVPDDVYNVIEEVSAGSLRNDLETSSSASNSIRASVSAGSATLEPGD